MKITILTLFPEMFNDFLNTSIIKRAINSKLVFFDIVNIRDYSILNNKQVDDTPYGGGAGMLMMLDPIVRALKDKKSKSSKVYLMSPTGKTFNQKMAVNLKENCDIILICGHYEGVDERITNYIDGEISIGDFVLTGGELASMVISDAVTRLVDGVISKKSLEFESFTNDMLDYPQYTKPSEYEGFKVPDVLLSGNHQEIAKWREQEAIKRTEERKNK